MIWYLLNILIVTIAYLWPIKQTEVDDGFGISKTRKKWVCIVGSFGWIIFSGFRHLSIGADTIAYKHVFEKTATMHWDELFQDLYNKFILGEKILDPGYRIVEKFVQVFTNDYQIFLIIIAVLFFTSMGVFLYKFSSDPYLGYILFSTLFYSFFAITGHRQTIATAIVVFMGTFLIKKKMFIPFLIITLLASTIHFSCLCFLPFYFISKIKINKATLLMYWAGIAGAFVFRNQLFSFLQSIIGYEDYKQTEGARVNTFLFVLLIVGVVVTFFHKKLLEGDNCEIVQMSINALMLACFFCPLILINENTMRVVQYFSLFLMIILPELIFIFSKKTDRTIIKMIFVGLLCFLLFKDPLSYKFFWQ